MWNLNNMPPKSFRIFVNRVERGVIEKDLFLKTSYSFPLNDQTKIVLEFEKNPFKNAFKKTTSKDVARVYLLDRNNKKHFVPLEKNYIDLLYMAIMEKLGRNNPHHRSGVKTFDFNIDPKIKETDIFTEDLLDIIGDTINISESLYKKLITVEQTNQFDAAITTVITPNKKNRR